ncbi:MAG: glycosyltransferase [Planctomycetota bacterium]|nr:glycosyltransferase [Planctomycetota bacterium]
MVPQIDIILPTRDRNAQLSTCLEMLASQDYPLGELGVAVVLDGPDAASAETVRRFAGHLPVRVLEAPRLGIAHAKNVAIASSRARLLLLINDDVLPARGFVAAHVAAHAERAEPAAIVGWSPFVVPEGGAARAFDVLVRDTSLIFFYDRMIDERGRALRPRDHDWGPRHAWNLNLSLPRSEARAVGGFRPAIANCCYEDVEFAWRLRERRGMPVLFRPEALAPHDHRYSASAYLERELRLGYSAHGFASAAPGCAREVLGRDVLSAGAAAEARAFLEEHAGMEAELREWLRGLERVPASEFDGAEGRERLQMAFDRHLPLKRATFRRGLLRALEGAAVPGLFHAADRLPTEPPLVAEAA